MDVELVAVTQGVGRFKDLTSDDLVAAMARVSNPDNELNTETAPRLLKYLIRQKHWSPFEMVNACVYIECPRDISRQILRHSSFRFQEFSGRYAEYPTLENGRELRIQDTTNRQNSLLTEDQELHRKWSGLVEMVRNISIGAYRTAIHMGVAKEVARILLPEGLVPTRMYMTGSIRSWIHYWDVRCDAATQKEHREVAMATRAAVLDHYKVIGETVVQN